MSTAAYQKAWRARNRERVNELKRADYYRHREENLAAHKLWRDQNPNYYKVRGAVRAANGEYKEYWKCTGKRKKYGLTEEQFLELVPRLEIGPCEICGTVEGPFHIDHDHQTKRFRGVLCKSCNNALGFAHDNPYILISAVHYLNRG